MQLAVHGIDARQDVVNVVGGRLIELRGRRFVFEPFLFVFERRNPLRQRLELALFFVGQPPLPS